MPLINLEYDLENVSSTFEALPAEGYLSRIVKVDFGESSTKKPMLTFEWEVTDGEYIGRKIFDNVVLSVTWKVKQYAELAGIETGTALNTEDFLGIEALVTVSVGEYQGKPNNSVESIEPA